MFFPWKKDKGIESVWRIESHSLIIENQYCWITKVLKRYSLQADHAEALLHEQQRSNALNDKLSVILEERTEVESQLDNLKFKVTEAVSKR